MFHMMRVFSCPVDHVLNCQPRIISLGVVEARSINVKNTPPPLGRINASGIKLRGYVQFNKNIHTPWEDQCEWHRMTRMTGLDCAVMCNLINTHTHTHTHTHTEGGGGRGGGVGAGVLHSENNGRIRWQPSLIGRLS